MMRFVLRAFCCCPDLHRDAHILYLQIDMNTQGSSHWDGLRHFPYQGSLQYYNGVTQEDISGANKNVKIGIQSRSQAFQNLKQTSTTGWKSVAH